MWACRRRGTTGVSLAGVGGCGQRDLGGRWAPGAEAKATGPTGSQRSPLRPQWRPHRRSTGDGRPGPQPSAVCSLRSPNPWPQRWSPEPRSCPELTEPHCNHSPKHPGSAPSRLLDPELGENACSSLTLEGPNQSPSTALPAGTLSSDDRNWLLTPGSGGSPWSARRWPAGFAVSSFYQDTSFQKHVQKKIMSCISWWLI